MKNEVNEITDAEAKGAVMINKGEFLDKVWTRLFSDVGLVYTPEFIRQPDWYLKHTWTEKQEQAYRDFFIRTAMEDLLLPKRLAVAKADRFIGWLGWEVDHRPSDPFARSAIFRKHLAAAEGGGISSGETAALLRRSEVVVLQRWRDRWLVGWKKRKAVLFPCWQFRSSEVLAGIEETLQVFQSDDSWRVMRYFLSRQHSLNEQRPLDLLRRGDVATIIKHANVCAEENTW
jgi:hypothetical protein